MVELIPLFPLSHVLLPGMPLPLHVFEQRYRDLVAAVTRPGFRRAFGVVALRSGTETLPAHARAAVSDVHDVGTIAEILELEQHDDGTADLLCVGSRRFRIDSVVRDGTAYLRAAVTYLDEPDGTVTPEQDRRARELLGIYDDMLTRLAGRATGAELPNGANQLSYDVAARLPLPPNERQSLLADATTEERLARVTRLMRREIALLQRTRSIAVSPAVLRVAAGTN